MAVSNEAALKEKLKKSPLGAYLIYGTEDYLKKVYVDKIVKMTVDDSFAEFNLHRIDGKESTLGEVYECVEAFPMMSDSTCVVVTDMQLDALDGDEMKMLEEMVADVPETCALVFYMQTVNVTPSKWKNIISLFEEHGLAVNLTEKEPADIVKTLENAAKKRNVPFDNGAARYLIECVGSDLNTLHNEMEKLCAYAFGRSIARADIDAVCSKSLEAKAFDIMRALHSGNFETAMKKLSAVIEQREDPIMLLGAFISSYMDIYRAKAAVISGFQETKVAEYYDYKKKEFRLRNALRDSKGLSLAAIYKCLDILAEADALLKGNDVDKVLVLEQTLAKLALAEGEGRR